MTGKEDSMNFEEMIGNMTEEELNALLAAIQAKLDGMAEGGEAREGEEGEKAELPEGVDQEVVDQLSDDIEDLEKLVDKITERKASLKDKAEKRSKLIRKLASGEAGRVVRTFEGSEEKKMTYGIETKEYRNAFLKNLQGKPLTAEERAAVTASAAIPQETMNKIWGKAKLFPLYDAVDVMHVPGTVILPVEGTVNAANVVAMGNAATDSADTISPVSLGVYKIIKTLEITADVEAMAIDAFEDWLVDRLSNQMFRKVTSLIAVGTGTNEPTGLATIDATGHTYTKAAMTYSDLLTIIAALPTEYNPGAKFVMSRSTFFTNVLNIQTTQKQPVVVADPQAPAKFAILGYEVILEDTLGDDVIFGDLKEGYVWNFGRDITIDRDESVGFRAGSVVYRGMALGDGKPTGVGVVRFTKAT